MTSSETLQFIGDELEVTYFNGSDYVTTTATYQSAYDPTHYGWQEHSESPCGFVANSLWIRYTFNAPTISSSPNYVTVRLNPTYSIFDTDFVYTAFCLSTSGDISSATYQSPNSDWYKGGTILNFANQNETSSGSGSYSWLGVSSGWNGHHLYIPVVMTSQSSFSAYCQNVQFYGVQPTRNTNGLFEFLVMCPYVGSNASGASGTFTTVSGGSGGGDVNVDVDLTETNSWLENIFDGISGIGSTISGLFMPDEQDMTDFYNDLCDLLDDSFSGYQDSTDILDDVKDTISNADPVSTITFPQVSVPHTNFSIGPYTVSLAPDSDLLDAVRLAIDLIATCAVINLIRLKIDEIIHGKVVIESEEVEMS